MQSAPMFLVGSSAVGALPVALIDFVSAVYVLRVWRRASRAHSDSLAALPLALFFLALGALALAQTVMTSILDVRGSFFVNYVLQSDSVLLSAPPIVSFAYGFLGRAFHREARVVVPVVTVVSLFFCVAFAVDFFQMTADDMIYDIPTEHTHGRERAFDPLANVISIVLLVSYVHALVVLLRKRRFLGAQQRASALAFAFVIAAAICAVVVNRLEAKQLLPVGTYTTYMLWVTLAAFLIFVTHTDAITRFHDRVAALVLVAVLAVSAVVAQRAVAELGRITASLPWLEARHAVDHVAFPAAVAMVAATLFVLLAVPRLAEVSVLRPLRRLERADADSRAKSVFLAAMSHELKTPLNAILHHARMLASPSTATPPRVASDLIDVPVERRGETIAVSAEHLLALVEALLAAGKADATASSLASSMLREPTSIRELVDDILLVHRATLGRRRMPVVVEIADSAADNLLVDRRMLRQILLNLVGNAARYGGGTVAIRATYAAPRLRILVEDEGPGIPAHARARIFEPFFRLNVGDGAGLGLAIARQLAEAMGGTLTLDDRERGSGFVVDIDAPEDGSSPAEAAPAPVVEAPAPPPSPSDGTAAALIAPASIAPEVRAELLALARIGDVAALRAKARSLEDVAAGKTLEALAERFQMRAIRRMLGEDTA